MLYLLNYNRFNKLTAVLRALSSECTPLSGAIACTLWWSSGLFAAFFNSLLIIFSVFSLAAASTNFCDSTDNFASADEISSVASACRARSYSMYVDYVYYMSIVTHYNVIRKLLY